MATFNAEREELLIAQIGHCEARCHSIDLGFPRPIGLCLRLGCNGNGAAATAVSLCSTRNALAALTLSRRRRPKIRIARSSDYPKRSEAY
jgi:hypothetical protein